MTLYKDTAQVEAIDGPKCSWYKAPAGSIGRGSSSLFVGEDKRHHFQDKLMAEVAKKRAVDEGRGPGAPETAQSQD